MSHTLTGQGFDASEDGTGRGTPIVVAGTVTRKWAKGSGGPAGDECQNLVAFQCHGSNVGPMGTIRRGRGDVQSGVPFVAYTLKAAHRGIENGWQGNYVAKPLGVRRLMPIECLRLQGLPDDWLDIDPALSDSAKYRLIGNSLAVPCVQWIMRRMAGVAA